MSSAIERLAAVLVDGLASNLGNKGYKPTHFAVVHRKPNEFYSGHRVYLEYAFTDDAGKERTQKVSSRCDAAEAALIVDAIMTRCEERGLIFRPSAKVAA